MSYFRNVELDGKWEAGGTYTFEVYDDQSIIGSCGIAGDLVLIEQLQFTGEGVSKAYLFTNNEENLEGGVDAFGERALYGTEDENWWVHREEILTDTPVGVYYLKYRKYELCSETGEETHGDWEFYKITIGGEIGNLQVILGPAKAVSDGAKWKVDSGSWLDSGVTVEDLSAGTHIVACKDVSGFREWVTPPNKNVVIVANKTAIVTRVYGVDAWLNRRYSWSSTAPDPWPEFPPFWWPDFWWEGTDLDPWPDEAPDPWPEIPPGGDYVDPDWYWDEMEDTWCYPGDTEWPEVAVAGGGRYQSQLIAIAENKIYFEEVS